MLEPVLQFGTKFVTTDDEGTVYSLVRYDTVFLRAEVVGYVSGHGDKVFHEAETPAQVVLLISQLPGMILVYIAPPNKEQQRLVSFERT